MSVSYHIEVNNVIIWSDNEAALQWIHNNNSYIIHIKNHVSEIYNNYSYIIYIKNSVSEINNN